MVVPVLVAIGVLLMILGGVFWLVVTVSSKYYEKLYESCTQTTTGVVEKVVESRRFRNMDGVKTYYPVYKYTVEGTDYFCQGNQGTFKKEKVSMAEAPIFYDPEKPGVSYLNRKANDRIFFTFKVVGTAFVALGILLILLRLLVLA